MATQYASHIQVSSCIDRADFDVYCSDMSKGKSRAVTSKAAASRLPCRICSHCDVDRANLERLLKNEDTSGGHGGPQTIGEGYGWGKLAPHLDSLAICSRPDRKNPMLVYKVDTDPCPYFSEDRGRILLPDDRRIVSAVPKNWIKNN